jgi:hypothetical protein
MAEKIKETTEFYLHELREAGGKAWEATQHALAAAGARAARYGKAMQRKLDLAALDRKVEGCYRDLGRLAFVAHRMGDRKFFDRPDALELLADLHDLGERREMLLREIEAARAGREDEAQVAGQAEEGSVKAEEERHL